MSSYAEQVGADEQAAIDVSIAVGEALTRVVVTGAEPPAGRGPRVLVVAEPLSGERLGVTLRGDGDGLLPRDDAYAPGAGIALLAHIAERVEVRAGDHGPTELRLTFRLRSCA